MAVDVNQDLLTREAAVKPERVRQILDSAAGSPIAVMDPGVPGPHGRPFARTFLAIAQLGLPLELLACLMEQTAAELPGLSDPTRALNNLERFFAAARNRIATASLFERDPTALPILLQFFSDSQHLSQFLINDPESFDALRLTAGQPLARATLVQEITDEAGKADSTAEAINILRRFKRRETLRIAYGDMIAHQDLSTVTSQLAYVADGICEAALIVARKQLASRFAWPLLEGVPCKFAVLSLGKLGGLELNYSSDIDLMLIYEADGQGPSRISHGEYFQRLAREFTKLIQEQTDLGHAYRVDWRLRPDGHQSHLVRSANAALSYYDLQGRTWERQAMLKLRPTAGDLDFGQHWIDQLQSWIYTPRITQTDISGIKALRRSMERQSRSAVDTGHNVKTGVGGIRDIEFVVQFLQLLHGRYHPELQQANTLDVLAELARIGFLRSHEHTLLDQNYRWLRRIEHRLQLMYDLKTHSLPTDELELQQLAMRVDQQSPRAAAGKQFAQRLQTASQQNREILNHLLQDAFPEPPSAGMPNHPTSEETDLILDPYPEPEWIQDILKRYHLKDSEAAFKQLVALAHEDSVFLPQARCRHFFAGITRPLLAQVAETPDPYQTLVSLNRVSQNIGGKAVLWELFQDQPALLQLFVQMSAACPYLCDILASHPGMIDTLLDSLLLQAPPNRRWLKRMLSDVTSNAEEIDLILHAFKDGQHLRVGIRDIAQRDAIEQTLTSLSDIAEVILQQIAQIEFKRLAARFGRPMGELDGQLLPLDLVIVAMGKLGGREPNYHSDLDVIFLYPGSGQTDHPDADKRISNQEFFVRLSTAITQHMTSLGPCGKLYELDSRLRPTGKSGSLAVSFLEFARYFDGGGAQTWERQALCKARPITGSSPLRRQVRQLIKTAITHPQDARQTAAVIYQMRHKIQEHARPHNLKRAPGGTVDIEFAVQSLQLQHARTHPQVLQTGTIAAGDALQKSGLMPATRWQVFRQAYLTLRNVEAKIRLMNLPASHDLPDEPTAQQKLGFLLNYDSTDELVDSLHHLRLSVRREFDRQFGY